MKDVYAIRRNNLARLLKEIADNNQSELARQLDISQPSLVNRYLRSKNIGDDVARHVERKAGKELGWLDNDHERKLHVYDNPISEEEADFGREWGKLEEPHRTSILNQVYLLVAAQQRAKSKPATQKRSQLKSKKSTDGTRIRPS